MAHRRSPAPLTLLLRPLRPAPWFYSHPGTSMLRWKSALRTVNTGTVTLSFCGGSGPGQRADAAGRTRVPQTSPCGPSESFQGQVWKQRDTGAIPGLHWDCSQDGNYNMDHANIPPAVFKVVTTNMVEKWFRGQSPTESKLWTFASIAPKRQQNTHT